MGILGLYVGFIVLSTIAKTVLLAIDDAKHGNPWGIANWIVNAIIYALDSALWPFQAFAILVVLAANIISSLAYIFVSLRRRLDTRDWLARLAFSVHEASMNAKNRQALSDLSNEAAELRSELASFDSNANVERRKYRKVARTLISQVETAIFAYNKKSSKDSTSQYTIDGVKATLQKIKDELNAIAPRSFKATAPVEDCVPQEQPAPYYNGGSPLNWGEQVQPQNQYRQVVQPARPVDIPRITYQTPPPVKKRY